MAGWRGILLPAAVAHGIWPIRKRSVLRFRLPFSGSWSPFVVRGALGKRFEPPCTDPCARWYGRGRRATAAAPMPIDAAGLETEVRKLLTGHEGGNAGESDGHYRTQVCDLAQAELAVEEPHGLVLQTVADPVAIELGFTSDEPMRANRTAFCLCGRSKCRSHPAASSGITWG
jgi:hypothetical protein